MAYHAVKTCGNCPDTFVANSNKQKYCEPCRPLVRKEKNKLWQHDYYMKNQERKLEETTAYNRSEKGRAAQKLRDAVRRGDIKRGLCEICDAFSAQGHHDDYSKPLEVRWLCAKHHREEHLFEPWQNDMRRAGYTGGFLLGQLIEACGERFTKLERNTLGVNDYPWAAWDDTSYVDFGDTPEEAVARLWLALNKKP